EVPVIQLLRKSVASLHLEWRRHRGHRFTDVHLRSEVRVEGRIRQLHAFLGRDWIELDRSKAGIVSYRDVDRLLQGEPACKRVLGPQVAFADQRFRWNLSSRPPLFAKCFGNRK